MKNLHDIHTKKCNCPEEGHYLDCVADFSTLSKRIKDLQKQMEGYTYALSGYMETGITGHWTTNTTWTYLPYDAVEDR